MLSLSLEMISKFQDKNQIDIGAIRFLMLAIAAGGCEVRK